MEDANKPKTKQASLNFNNKEVLYTKILNYSNKLRKEFNRPVSFSETLFVLLEARVDEIEHEEGKLDAIETAK